MVTPTLFARTLPLLFLGLVLAPPPALAQENGEQRSRVVIRMNADSIYVEREGETTVVPNTPEGRARLDAEDLAFGDGDGLRRFHFEVDDFDVKDFAFGGKDSARVFRLRGDGPSGFGPRALASFGLGGDARWFAADAEAQTEIMEMERRTQRLARDVRDAEDPATRADLEAELDALLAELFARKLEQRRARVEALEAEWREQQDRLNAREGARDEIIERRKRELLGNDVLDW